MRVEVDPGPAESRTEIAQFITSLSFSVRGSFGFPLRTEQSFMNCLEITSRLQYINQPSKLQLFVFAVRSSMKYVGK